MTTRPLTVIGYSGHRFVDARRTTELPGEVPARFLMSGPDVRLEERHTQP